MTKDELIQLKNSLQGFKKLESTKLSYAIMKNLRKIDKEVEKFPKMKKQDPKLREWDKKRLALCVQFAKSDENGKPMITEGNYEIDNKEEFEKACEELELEYKEVLDNEKQRYQEYLDMLQEEVVIELYKVKKESLPENLTVEELELIEPIIDESK